MRCATPIAAALLCLASPAVADSVVVLEIDGDENNALREQIEGALRDVVAVPLEKYKEAAAKKKLKGAAAMTAVGVARAGKALAFDAVVGGEIAGSSIKVVIFDHAGEELWSKTLPVSDGLLSDDLLKKLSRAIAAAAAQGAAQAPATQPDQSELGGGLDLSDVGKPEGASSDGPVTATAVRPEDPNRDVDLDHETHGARTPGPSLVRVTVQGTTTWRTQCLRPTLATTPATTTCAAADAATRRAEGVPIDYLPEVPYLGFEAQLEVFPLARLESSLVRGFGVVGHVAYGSTTTRGVETTVQGPGPTRNAATSDLAWAAEATWRLHFAAGLGTQKPVGFAGLRGGVGSRSFSIDPSGGVALPSSQRAAFGQLGVDVSVPVLPALRFEGALSLFVGPTPSAEQILGFGNASDPTGGVVSSGWGFELGVAGDLWGPLGYSVRARRLAFDDQYFGAGRKWTVCNETQCGGVSQESFVSVLFGVSARF